MSITLLWLNLFTHLWRSIHNWKQNILDFFAHQVQWDLKSSFKCSTKRVNVPTLIWFGDKPFTTNCEKAIISFAVEISRINFDYEFTSDPQLWRWNRSSVISHEILLKNKLKIYRISGRLAKKFAFHYCLSFAFISESKGNDF